MTDVFVGEVTDPSTGPARYQLSVGPTEFRGDYRLHSHYKTTKSIAPHDIVGLLSESELSDQLAKLSEVGEGLQPQTIE